MRDIKINDRVKVVSIDMVDMMLFDIAVGDVYTVVDIDDGLYEIASDDGEKTAFVLREQLEAIEDRSDTLFKINTSDLARLFEDRTKEDAVDIRVELGIQNYNYYLYIGPYVISIPEGTPIGIIKPEPELGFTDEVNQALAMVNMMKMAGELDRI